MTSPEPGGTRPRVVIAEDKVDERELLALVLRQRGFDAVGAADGSIALEMILAEGADGLVSDVDMPHLDGLGLCHGVRALRGHAQLPIVVYTGARDDDERVQALRQDAWLRVLNKPMGLSGIAPALVDMWASMGRSLEAWAAGSSLLPGRSAGVM